MLGWVWIGFFGVFFVEVKNVCLGVVLVGFSGEVGVMV